MKLGGKTEPEPSEDSITAWLEINGLIHKHFSFIIMSCFFFFLNLARQLDRSDFDSEIQFIHLANLHLTAFLIGLEISLDCITDSFTYKEAGPTKE